jgi:hypothetical protein
MNSDEENKEQSTPRVQKSELLRYIDDWEGDACKMEAEHILLWWKVYIIFIILIGVTNWVTEALNFISRHGKDSPGLLGNTSNIHFSGTTLLFCKFCSTCLY